MGRRSSAAMTEVTLATFNIHWGRGPVRGGLVPFDVPAACANLDAEVIVLQESWAPDDAPSHHDATAAMLGWPAAASASLGRSTLHPLPEVIGPPGAVGVGEGGWGVAVISRFPILRQRQIDLPPLRLDKVHRALLLVDLDVDGSPLTVIGTHFSHLEFGSVRHAGPLRRSLPAPDQAAVLLGDMNMWGWCLSAIAPAGWTRIGSGKTWPAHRPISRIDHVLCSDAVREVWSDVSADLGSDHRAVRARIRIP